MVELPITLWLKPEDVGTEAELVFVDEGKRSEIPMGEGEPSRASFEITVRLPNGEPRSWTMNPTAQRATAQAYGLNTMGWIGKRVTAYTANVNVRGVMKRAIYARVPK